MVEVFKTNVGNRIDAEILLKAIHNTFPGCIANFDLEDCDKILRVKNEHEPVQAHLLIEFLTKYGFTVKVLCESIHTN